MSSEIKKIYNLLFSVGFSSIGFIAAITVTALAVREVTTNPYLVGIPNALGVGGAFVGTQIFDYLQKKYSRMLALANTFFEPTLSTNRPSMGEKTNIPRVW